jgi:ABC-2 type transport system permease protein
MRTTAGAVFPVDRVPVCMEVLSKANPVTYGVEAIRQIFFGSGLADAGPGVTVLGHTLAIGEEVALVSELGIVLVAGAVWAFGRQEQ